MPSLDDGVPESELSADRRRSSSATRSSSFRSRTAATSMRDSTASTCAFSTAICSSFAATTARNRAASGWSADSSGMSRKHAQPELKLQASRTAGVSPPGAAETP
jgi:hypothetical protein